MGQELPCGWAYTTIEGLISSDGLFKDGDWVESKDQDSNGSVRLIQLADIGDGCFVNKSSRFLTSQKAKELNCTFLKRGDILVARMPDPLGRACIFPLEGEGKYVTVVDVCIIRTGSVEIDRNFLMFLINNTDIRSKISSLQSGSTRKRISRKNLSKVELPIAPLNEQKRIVAKIEELFSELDNGITALKTAREKLKLYRQAVLKHAFEGKLTAQWREENKDKLETPEQLLARIQKEREARYQQQLEEWKAAVKVWEENGKEGKKPNKPKAFKAMNKISDEEISILPGIPNEWRYTRLAEIAFIGSGMSVSKGRKLNDPIEVAYLRVANVQRGCLMLDEIKTMPVERDSLPDLALEKWDILFNEGGDRDKLGRGWIWESQISPCITQNHVFRASPIIKSEYHSKFISHWGNSFGKSYFERGGKQTTNLASINKTVLSNFPIPLPSMEEQQQLINILDDIMSQIVAMEIEVENGIKRAETLRQSILKKAFSGQLVPQDPNDEPASELLARIQAERESIKKKNSKRARTGK